MHVIRIVFISFILLGGIASSNAQKLRQNDAIYSGVPWYDDKGNIVSAHGAGMIKVSGSYYLFGEKHADTSNIFTGFNCYSSTDLYNWKFESLALPVQSSGRLGPNTVGERPKVMKCPKTGEFIMYMHSDSIGYKNQCVGYATAKYITGPYQFRGPLLFNEEPIKKWDMGTFQDTDGKGYILIHGGEMYELGDDYKSVVRLVVNNKWPGTESPAVFKHNGNYFWLGAELTSWERNDNFYYTATDLKGPWTNRGLFAPEGSLTWNSQTTFVLPITGQEDTSYLYMGDRWSFPYQASSATYVWQPLTISGTALSIPKYKESWNIDLAKGTVSTSSGKQIFVENTDSYQVRYSAGWKHISGDNSSFSFSDQKDAAFTIGFHGSRIGMKGELRPDGGYARMIVKNKTGKVISSTQVDMYCKYPVHSLVYLSAVLPVDDYVLTVQVTGEHGSWSDKRKSNYGSTGNFVSLDKFIIRP